MDSRRRQRNMALNHIPPLPILHGLEYPLGSRMHLVVVHSRLEARERPFPRSPGSRSRVNLRVLRPLTRGPQGQPSPLRTPHGRPGVQGIFRTSHGQIPHGWPLVPHSMAISFPIPLCRCMASVAARSTLLYSYRFATSRSRSPHPVSGPAPAPGFPPSPVSVPHPVFIPDRAASNPLARAHWILIHSGTVLCPLHGSFLSSPLRPCFGRLLVTHPWIVALGFSPTLTPRPLVPVLSCAPSPIHVYTPPGRQQPSAAAPKDRFVPPCTGCCYSYPSFRAHLALCFFSFFLVFLPLVRTPLAVLPPPTPPRCVLCCASSCGFFFRLSFCLFFLPSSLHALTTRQHWISFDAALLLSLLWSSRPCGALLYAVPGHASWAPLPCVSPSVLPAPSLPPLRASRPSPPYYSSPASCAPRCSSPRHGCIFIAHTRRSAGGRSSSR